MKKTLLTVAACLALTGTAFAVPAGEPDQATETVGTIVITEVAAVPAECTEACEDFPGDDSVLPESGIAKKMTQAEKARNAAENDSWGGAITIIAMCIVVSALAILSILFLIFGKISEALLASKKRKTAKTVDRNGEAIEHERLDSGDAIAAIAMALSEHFGEGHDMEDTILTIRSLKRSYSPWNSKIYNLRQTPALNRHNHGRSAF